MYFNDDRKLLESATQIIDEVVANLPKAEQSEYHLRLRTYQNCFPKKTNLIKDKNWLYENYQKRLKQNKKEHLIVACMFIAYLVANWLFNFVTEEKMGVFVAFAIAYAAYLVLAEKIYESEYTLKMKLYDFEIEGYELEISKIGVFSSMYRYTSMENFESYSEAIQRKMLFDNECYHVNCHIEILKAMCVIDDISEEARLRVTE